METKKRNYTNVDEYIALYPKDVQVKLQQVRQTIKKAAPKAEEVISYKIPGYKFNGMLVWFAAFKEHIGLYPRVSAIEVFKKELFKYELSKGTIRFPLDEPMPLKLISAITKYRVKENLERIAMKDTIKKKK